MGRVLPPTVSRTYGTVSAMPTTPASRPRTGASRSSVKHPQRERAAEVRDRDCGRGAGVERPAGEDVHETPVADLIGVDGNGAGLDELHRRPALELTIAEPVQHERAVRAHADGVDQARHETTQRAGVFEPAALAAVQIDRREHAPRLVGLAARNAADLVACADSHCAPPIAPDAFRRAAAAQ